MRGIRYTLGEVSVVMTKNTQCRVLAVTQSLVYKFSKFVFKNRAQRIQILQETKIIRINNMFKPVVALLSNA